MSAPSRFPNGLTNVASNTATGMLGVPDPSKWHVYFNDFDVFNAADWIITTTELGAASAVEQIVDDDGGMLQVRNDDADNDNDFLQLASETFKFEAGKRLFFKARWRTSDATATDMIMGLQITDTTPLSVTDGVFFQKDDGDTNLDFHVIKDSTATTSTAVTTMANNVFMETAFYYDGKSEVQVFIDDVKRATLATTNLPDDEELTVSFGIQNGGAAQKFIRVDYILVAKER